MPWRTTNVDEQRMQFVIRATSGAALRLMPGVWYFPADGLSVATALRAIRDAYGDPRAQSATSWLSEPHRTASGAARGSAAKADGLGREKAARAAERRRDSAGGANDPPDSGPPWFGERTGAWSGSITL